MVIIPVNTANEQWTWLNIIEQYWTHLNIPDITFAHSIWFEDNQASWIIKHHQWPIIPFSWSTNSWNSPLRCWCFCLDLQLRPCLKWWWRHSRLGASPVQITSQSTETCLPERHRFIAYGVQWLTNSHANNAYWVMITKLDWSKQQSESRSLLLLVLVILNHKPWQLVRCNYTLSLCDSILWVSNLEVLWLPFLTSI